MRDESNLDSGGLDKSDPVQDSGETLSIEAVMDHHIIEAKGMQQRIEELEDKVRDMARRTHQSYHLKGRSTGWAKCPWIVCRDAQKVLGEGNERR